MCRWAITNEKIGVGDDVTTINSLLCDEWKRKRSDSIL
jgi:hypothetical protein